MREKPELPPNRQGEKGSLNESSEIRSLLARHLKGDNQAFGEIVSMYRSEIFTYLARCGVQESCRDDLFQEIFLNVHRYASRYDPALPLAPWIFTIAVNRVRSHFRSASRNRVTAHEEHSETPAADASPHEKSEAVETAAWLEGELAKIPLSEREAFILCCVQNLEQREAAKILDIPLNTVKTNVRRARLRLAKALALRNTALRREVLS